MGRDCLGAMADVRWPLTPLLRYTRQTPYGFARRYGVSTTSISHAIDRGLNDRQADHWALAAGMHPALIWGPEWFDAAPQDDADTEAHHAVYVCSALLPEGELFRAECSCGWESKWFANDDNAYVACDQHRADGLPLRAAS